MLVPVGTAWADLQLGATRSAGPFAHVEVVGHPWERVGLYAFGQVSRQEAMAGIGARVALW
jgi:hypothetical protein